MKPIVIENFLSEEECSLQIEFLEKNIDKAFTGPKKLKYQLWNSEMDENYKNISLRFVDKARDLFKEDLYLAETATMKYLPGYSMFLHTDGYFNEVEEYYDYTCLIYLNDNFSGGGLSFPNIDYTYIPKMGDAMFFKANDPDFDHAVLTVEGGTRFGMFNMLTTKNTARYDYPSMNLLKETEWEGNREK
jgi:hypothetical protein